MALTLPTSTALDAHKEEIDNATAMQRAADLLTVATGLTDTPSDALEARLVETAILDMAWYLQTRHEDQEEEFSPFTSERIGSYSYSKAQKAVQAQTDTGVPGFDIAVDYFAGLANAAAGLLVTDSEWVFAKGYQPSSETGPGHLVWEHPVVSVLDGGSLELDEYGNPVLEIEDGGA